MNYWLDPIGFSILVLGRKPPPGDASMVTWVKCPKCRGEVGISDNSDSDVLCPRCREPVLLVDPESKTRWVPGKPPRSWRRPSGWILVSIAIFMMLYRFLGEAGHRNPSLLVVLLEYVTDPFILVGMPLGIYWIQRPEIRLETRRFLGRRPEFLAVCRVVDWIRRGSSSTRANDGPIPPVEQATPTIANSITTDSASTGNSAPLAVGFCVVAFGVFIVMMAILNSSTDSNRKVEFDKAIADSNRKVEFDQAIAYYNEAIRLQPTFAVFYNNRGNAWNNKKEYDNAIADYNQAIRLDPQLEAAYYNRGLAWEYKNNFDKAIADYSEAIRLNPNEESRERSLLRLKRLREKIP